MTDLAGRYHDGRTAAAHPVRVRPSLSGLDIRGEDNRSLGFWHRADLRPQDGPGPQLRLACATAPGARLTVVDGAALRPFLPERPTGRPWLRGVALGAAGLAMAAGLWVALPAVATMVARAIPLETEIRLGGGLADRMERQWGTCTGAEGNAALAALAERLAAHLPPEQRSLRVAVVKAKAENAFALPGGRVLLLQGLLDKAESPDEIAGVLAHEFTHVAERHVAAAMVRALGISALVALVTGDSSGLLAGGATMALAGAYSRDDEAAADRGAVELLGKAGIGTSGLAGFFRRVAKQDGGIPEWLSSHPDPEARARAVEASARPGLPPALPARQWKALKGICG